MPKFHDEEKSICRQNLEVAKIKKSQKQEGKSQASEEVQIIDEREAKELDLSLMVIEYPSVQPMNRMLDREKLKQNTLDEDESKI